MTSLAYPLLVSELPPVPLVRRSSRWSRLGQRRSTRRDALRLELSISQAAPQERVDLLHAARRL